MNLPETTQGSLKIITDRAFIERFETILTLADVEYPERITAALQSAADRAEDSVTILQRVSNREITLKTARQVWGLLDKQMRDLYIIALKDKRVRELLIRYDVDPAAVMAYHDITLADLGDIDECFANL